MKLLNGLHPTQLLSPIYYMHVLML